MVRAVHSADLVARWDDTLTCSLALPVGRWAKDDEEEEKWLETERRAAAGILSFLARGNDLRGGMSAMNRVSKEFRPYHFGKENPVTVLLPEPDFIPTRAFVGREELIEQCMAAWLDLDGEGALHFRLVGPPGVGKNELVYHLAREVEKKPLYIMHGHEELTPEDIACTARITKDHGVEYVGSPLLAAMVRGGICFFDEIGKVPSRSLSLLASVLDGRRTITSVLAGFTERAHADFRFCAAMNDADAATYGLPGYIDERLRPAFKMTYPPIEEVMEIVGTGVMRSTHVLLDCFRSRIAHREDLSPREALILIGYATRLHRQQGSPEIDAKGADELLALAMQQVGHVPP